MFRLLVNGKEVERFAEQVTKVTLMTARGAVGQAGISPTDGSVDLQVEFAQPGGPIRLDHIENQAAQAIRDRGEGQRTGQLDPQVDKSLIGTQGGQDYTAREGGVDAVSNEEIVAPPSRDLTEGLDSDDVEGRTRRIEDFTRSGDADAVISGEPADSDSVLVGSASADSDPVF